MTGSNRQTVRNYLPAALAQPDSYFDAPVKILVIVMQATARARATHCQLASTKISFSAIIRPPDDEYRDLDNNYRQRDVDDPTAFDETDQELHS